MAVAVLAAAAPGIAGASGDLTQSQELVSLSELNGEAVVLAHTLADERDTMTEFVAAGRNPASGVESVSESRRARVDRQVAELRADAPADLRRELAGLPKIRQEAQSGRGSATATFGAYTKVVEALHAVTADLDRRTPPRASGGPGRALPALGRAVEQASATRGLLLGALSAGGSQSRLTAAAQTTRVQERAALADFGQTAPQSARDRFANTVNGTEVTTAERYADRLTDQPALSLGDQALSRDKVEAALSGRIDRMRAVESSLTTTQTDRLAALRDDDVTALEVQIALGAVCLLLAVGISMSAARSMTRPLAALRLGARRVAADPAAEEPVRFTGRNDEFAEAVRSVNELHATAARLHARVEQLGDDRTRLVAERQRLAEEREELRRAREELAERLTGLQDRVHHSFISLSLRTLGLVERQLGVIEGLEDREDDPDRLDTLFTLDHLATRMRRHSENLLVLAGAEHGGWHGGGHGGAPVPLLDVLRAAVSEIERYERVEIHSLPPHAQVAGFAADAVSHLIAELLENATAFSPPDAEVELSGWLLESGEVMLSIQDEGIGMTAERLAVLNERLADPQHVGDGAGGGHGADGGSDGDDDELGLGLYVVARLAARHGVRVQLRQQKQGGVAAVAVLPKSILPTRPTPSGPAGVRHAPEQPAVNLPGSIAEANSNALPRRAVSPPAQSAQGAAPEAPEEPSAPIAATAGPEAPGAPADPADLGAPLAATEREALTQEQAAEGLEAPVQEQAAEGRPTAGNPAAQGGPVLPGPTDAQSPAAPESAAAQDPFASESAAQEQQPEPVRDPFVEAAERAVAAAESGASPSATDEASAERGEAAADDAAAPRQSLGAPRVPEQSRTDDDASARPAAWLNEPLVPEQPAVPAEPGEPTAGGPDPAPDADRTGERPGTGSGALSSSFDLYAAGTVDAPGEPNAPAEPGEDAGRSGGPGPSPDADADASGELPGAESGALGPASGSYAEFGARDDARAPEPYGADGGGVGEPADDAEEQVAPAASGPYAIGPDTHAHAEDGADTIGRPAQGSPASRSEEAAPRQAGHHPHGSTVSEAGSGTEAQEDTARRARPGGAPVTDGGGAGEAGPGAAPRRLTEKGLPKRTPKNLSPIAPARERTRSVDAAELRRRLGGFQQGSRDGRRDAEREIAEDPGTGTDTGTGTGSGTGTGTGTGAGDDTGPGTGTGSTGTGNRTGAGEEQTGALDEGGTVEEARG